MRCLAYYVEERPDFGVTLVVTHTCGHDGRYFFAAKEFASKQAESYSQKECTSCANARELARLDQGEALGE